MAKHDEKTEAETTEKPDKEAVKASKDAEARTQAEAKARSEEPDRTERQVQVKFKESVTTDEAQPRTFAAGSTATLPESSARHWINRRKAEVVSEDDRDLHAAIDQHDAAARLPKVKPATGAREVPEPLTARETRGETAAHRTARR